MEQTADSSLSIIGSLSNNDDKGGENVTQKVNSRCFKLHRSYSNIFNLSNIGDFFGSWIRKECIQVQKNRKRKTLSCVHVRHKTWNKEFSRRSRGVTAKKGTIKRDARAELLFCQSKPIAFLPFSLPLPSSLLKLPNIVTSRPGRSDYPDGQLCRGLTKERIVKGRRPPPRSNVWKVSCYTWWGFTYHKMGRKSGSKDVRKS